MRQLITYCIIAFTIILFACASASATNYSLRFDGSDDYVSVDQQIQFSPSYTIECWFKVEQTSNDKCILTSFIPDVGNYIYISVQGDGTVRFCHRVPASKNAGDGGNISTPTSPRYDDNVWHHLAAVYDNNIRTMYIYIDGNLRKSSQLSTQWGILIPNLSTIYFGKNTSWDTRWFERYLDELRIWNTARTQAQIQGNMCHELTGTETDLNVYFKFDEGNGTVASDSKIGSIVTAALNSTYSANWWYAGFASSCSIYQGKMALWLDPFDINGNGTNPATNTNISTWVDKTATPENAVMSDVNRQPVYKTDGIYVTSSDKKPGVLFTFDYGATKYGYSDILESPFNAEITSGVTNVYTPTTTNKTLFVVFQTGNDVDMDVTGDTPDPYYSDGRQTIFEAGGPLSGYNIYLSQGKLVFGMWNRFESKYIMADNSNIDIYPLVKNKIYIAILEYKNGKFRGILIGYKRTGSDPATGTLSTMVSQPFDFSGLTNDPDNLTDYSGIGGARRTAYYDYNTGETYSDHFGGVIGDIILYNDLYNGGDPQDVMDYLIHKYDLVYSNSYPSMSKQGDYDWKYFDNSNNVQDVQLSSAYPNPFTTTTSFGINLPETQNVIIELFNDQGSKVQNIYAGELSKGVHDFKINGDGLSSGLYLFKVTGNSFVQTSKVILTK